MGKGDSYLSFIPQDIVGAYTTQFNHAFIEAQSQAVSLADANFELIYPAQFLQPQGRMVLLFR